MIPTIKPYALYTNRPRREPPHDSNPVPFCYSALHWQYASESHPDYKVSEIVEVAFAHCEPTAVDTLNPFSISGDEETTIPLMLWQYRIIKPHVKRPFDWQLTMQPYHPIALEIVGANGQADIWGYRFVETAYIVAHIAATYRDVLLNPREFMMIAQEWESYLIPRPKWQKAFNLAKFAASLLANLLELQKFAFSETLEEHSGISAGIEQRFAEVAALINLFLLFRRQWPNFPAVSHYPAPKDPEE